MQVFSLKYRGEKLVTGMTKFLTLSVCIEKLVDLGTKN